MKEVGLRDCDLYDSIYRKSRKGKIILTEVCLRLPGARIWGEDQLNGVLESFSADKNLPYHNRGVGNITVYVCQNASNSG